MSDFFTLVHYGDHAVLVEGSYTAAEPDVWYLPNGDPGHPGVPESLDVDAYWLCTPKGQKIADITNFLRDLPNSDALLEAICDKALENDAKEAEESFTPPED